MFPCRGENSWLYPGGKGFDDRDRASAPRPVASVAALDAEESSPLVRNLRDASDAEFWANRPPDVPRALRQDIGYGTPGAAERWTALKAKILSKRVDVQRPRAGILPDEIESQLASAPNPNAPWPTRASIGALDDAPIRRDQITFGKEDYITDHELGDRYLHNYAIAVHTNGFLESLLE